jgi:hypothetical protein
MVVQNTIRGSPFGAATTGLLRRSHGVAVALQILIASLSDNPGSIPGEILLKFLPF